MRCLFVVLPLLLIGCASPSGPESSHHSASQDRAFYRLADEYIAGHLAWRPATGVALGLHEFDGRVTDYSPASLQAERARLARFDEEFSRFPSKDLSAGASQDLRIVQTAIRRQRFQFDALQSYTGNPMTYAGALGVNIYIKRNFAPLEHRVRCIISILEQAPQIFAAARTNLHPRLPRPYIETAIQVADGSAEFLGRDLITALKDFSDGALKARFDKANQRAVQELRDYVQWLKKDRLPAATEEYFLGVEKFGRMLAEGELIQLPPDRILELGLAELKREQEAFARAAKQIDPSKPPVEVYRAIQKDHPTEESLIPDTRRNMEAIRQFLVDHDIVTIPSVVRPRVEETPQFDRATSFASMDTPGPFEKVATEAYYYVTPVEKDWPPQQKEEWLTAFNYYTTDVVSIHEAWPGHYLQFLCLNASPASRVRKIFDSYSFVEGWAHYTEQMILDAGFGPSMPSQGSQSAELKVAKYRLAQSGEALLRLCRLCVAIRMHCHRTTIDDATRFFMENCYYEEKPSRSEATRGSYDPEYLYYTVGKLQILKLRKDYERQEGARFSLKRFHDELLSHGAPPLRILREVMLKDPSLWEQSF
ncbi:MAG TPA: DUF885 domain-containing protein [Verrucomicrobiae bacterium]|nr:DUF885 domain-containing protein [Verrucomicrobiae bacterium]